MMYPSSTGPLRFRTKVIEQQMLTRTSLSLRVWPVLLSFHVAIVVCLGWGLVRCAQSAEPARVVAGYYAEWSALGRGYQVADIPARQLTHVIYAHLRPTYDAVRETGGLDFFDHYAAVEMAFPGDTDDLPFKGNLRQLVKLRTAFPHLRTLVSVGGAAMSADFSDIAASARARSTFVNRCVEVMLAHGFDGIDLDWEFPVEGGEPGVKHRPEDADNYLLLIRELRERLRVQEVKDGRPYLLTVATSATAGTLTVRFRFPELSDHVDWINLMAYNLSGPWLPETGHQAPLYGNPQAPPPAHSVAAGINRYLSLGVPRDKLVIGVPFYGQGLKSVPNINNGLFQSHEGACEFGTWTQGIFQFHDLRDGTRGHAFFDAQGYTVYWDPLAQASFLYDPEDRVFITYESERSLRAKAVYVLERNLRGMMFWSLDGDTADHALTRTVQGTLALAPHLSGVGGSRSIAGANFDHVPAAWYYSYAYGGYGGLRFEETIAPETLPNSYDPKAPVGIEGSAALEGRGDFSAVPSVGTRIGNQTIEWVYAGLGLGAGLTDLQRSNLISADLGDYAFSFAVGAMRGLRPGQNGANGSCKVQVQVPDNTLPPADADALADNLVEVVDDFVAPGSDYKTFKFRLNEGRIEGGSAALFRQFLTNVTQINVNFNFSAIPAEFGADADNAVAVDELALTYEEPAVPLPAYPERVGGVDFDETKAQYIYGYAYGGYDGADVTAQLAPQTLEVNGAGMAGSRALVNSGAKFSLVKDVPPAKEHHAGFGLGAGLTFDASAFDTARLEDYDLRFDLRVGGLAVGVSEAAALVTLQFEGIDGTLGLEVLDGEFDVLLRLTTASLVPAAFRTYAIPLSQMKSEQGAFDLVVQNLRALTNLTVDVQVTDVPTDLGCDDNNLLVLDNVRLVRRVVGTPDLRSHKIQGDLVLEWPGEAVLQSASSLEAPFSTIPGARSPFRVTPDFENRAAFYRVYVP